MTWTQGEIVNDLIEAVALGLELPPCPSRCANGNASSGGRCQTCYGARHDRSPGAVLMACLVQEHLAVSTAIESLFEPTEEEIANASIHAFIASRPKDARKRPVRAGGADGAQ